MMQITIAKISDQLSEKKKDYENLEIKIKKVKIEIDKKNEEYKMLEEEILLYTNLLLRLLHKNKNKN